MKSLRIPLRVVFYKEEGNWIAHCLELDLVGDGKGQREALELLVKAIETQLELCFKNDALDCFFSPAEAKYFAMFAAGTDTNSTQASLTIPIEQRDRVEIRPIELREFTDAVDGHLELVDA